jgi:hypothetical protein
MKLKRGSTFFGVHNYTNIRSIKYTVHKNVRFLDMDCVVARGYSDGLWSVLEVESGIRFGFSHRTAKEALASTKAIVDALSPEDVARGMAMRERAMAATARADKRAAKVGAK